MPHKTKIYGYIECTRDTISVNNLVLSNFEFDEFYPFTNNFGKFLSSFTNATASFSLNFKGDAQADWNAWIERFEELLGCLKISSASVVLDSEMQSARCIRDYVVFNGNIECFAGRLIVGKSI